MIIKKILVTVVAILTTVGISLTTLLTTASMQKKEPLDHMISNESNWEKGRMEQILNDGLNTPTEELPIYPFTIISLCVGSRGIVLNKNSVGNTLNWFNDVANLKTSNIQKIDNENIAVLYKTLCDGLDESYVFIIFKKTIDKVDNSEFWEKTGEAYFVKEVNSIENYENINPGTSVEELYNIDNSIHYDVLRKELSIDVIKSLKSTGDIYNPELVNSNRMIYKLLKNGILLIEYDINMTIIEKKYYPYEDKSVKEYTSVINSALVDYIKDAN